MSGAPNQPNFAARAATIAEDEWVFFGRQTYDLSGHAAVVGHKEGETAGPNWAARIGVYWVEGCGKHGLTGSNHDWPWSAAFISWVMKRAGAGDRFHYSAQHSQYISQAIRDRLNGREDAGYWCDRLNEAKPAPGDLVCWSREAGVDYNHQLGGNYDGHCDLVVEVSHDRIQVIGGNVGDSVTKRPLVIDADGYLRSATEGGEVLFALMKNRLG